ncbi:MAG: HIT family protein [Flavobacteriales bacterium]|nr:HIT family protein [Flavobacteriales bacterium]
MATLFTKIIKGEIPSYKIAENEFCYAFLDIYPLQKGHTLVVPKTEVDQFFELDDHMIKELMSFSKQVAKGIKKAFSCHRIGSAIIGFDVPHAHVHLIPINKTSDMNFANEKLQLTTDEFEQIAAQIRKNL